MDRSLYELVGALAPAVKAVARQEHVLEALSTLTK